MKTENHNSKMYLKLLVMGILSFIAMYILMYSMVDRFANVYNNINQVYMAALMAFPMVIFEVIIMWSMYHNKKLNIILIAASVILMILAFSFIRMQTAVGDVQFIRSMIPHHSSAILMCDESDLSDPELIELCKSIKETQQREIDQMNSILDRLNQ